jgi:hypothetical protein
VGGFKSASLAAIQKHRFYLFMERGEAKNKPERSQVRSLLHEESPMIIVHHLNDSRSQRILWLLEELNVPYEIK